MTARTATATVAGETFLDSVRNTQHFQKILASTCVTFHHLFNSSQHISHIKVVSAMTFFSALPDDVLTQLLTHWISLKAQSRLDSAMCNHEIRCWFLNLLQSPCFITGCIGLS